MSSDDAGLERRNQRPLVVDLYCSRGGVGRALDNLGFDHIGVDIVDYGDEYPGEFIQGDASRPPLDVSPDLLWMSPPCTAYSTLSYANFKEPREHYPTFDDLNVREVIAALEPEHYIIENVPTCEDLRDPTALNGLAFGKEYDNLRHFETSFPCPDRVRAGEPTVSMNTRQKWHQRKGPLARAKGVPETWTMQEIRSAVPQEYVQHLLYYCPSVEVPYPEGYDPQGMLTEVPA